MISAAQCRVFFVTLPPLTAQARVGAVRTFVRARIANPAASIFVLSTTPLSGALWCAVVAERGTPLGADTMVEPALAPWQPNGLIWIRDASVPFVISPRGESIVLDTSDDELPNEIIRLSTYGATVLEIVGHVPPPIAAQWSAQLGLPVRTRQRDAKLPAIRWSAPHTFDDHTPLPQRVSKAAAWVACMAGAAHAAFAGWDAIRAHDGWSATQRASAKVAAKHNQTPDGWRSWLAQSSPHAARDSASGLLRATLPALAPTAARVSAVNAEPRALSIEWNTLTDSERTAFEAVVQSQGAGVVASGKRARVVWP
jgi:hypothetical protein